MKCKLEKQIDHSKIREQFRKVYVECPLLERQDAGMNSLGVICGGCCIRLSQLLESKKDLLLRSIVSVEDYRRNPDIIREHLPEHLGEYYEALEGLGKTINDVSSECSHCKPEPVDNKPIYASEKTEMTECGRNDLR